MKAHQEIKTADSFFEAWQWWNNGAADRAARMSNASRPHGFWSVWSQFASEYFTACKLHDQVVVVHMAVADFSLQSPGSDELLPTPRLPREGRVFTNQFDASQWDGHIPTECIRLYGVSLCRKLVHWWLARCRFTTVAELKWIPITFLYIDYQLSCGCVPAPELA